MLANEDPRNTYRGNVSKHSGEAVSGHPEFCPEPVRVQIAGSTWGGSMLKQYFIGRGMHLEFMHPKYRRVLTSAILEIHQSSPLR